MMMPYGKSGSGRKGTDMGLGQNLKIVWDEATGSLSGVCRYSARSLDGGAEWGVWDKRAARFLKDREVAALTLDEIRATRDQ